MSARRQFWLVHAAVAAALLLFAIWALLVAPRLPASFVHCFLHDVLHLYCPLCGGTRALAAALRGDVWAMLCYQPAVPVALAVLAVFDVRAFWRMRRGEARLFPAKLLPALCALLLLFAAVRDALALFGVDPAGDLAPFWQGRLPLWRAAVCTALFICLAACLSALCGLFRQGQTIRLVRAALAKVAAIAAVLTGQWWWLAACLPLAVWAATERARGRGKR